MVDNIKVDIQEIQRNGLDRIFLGEVWNQWRTVGATVNLNGTFFPKKLFLLHGITLFTIPVTVFSNCILIPFGQSLVACLPCREALTSTLLAHVFLLVPLCYSYLGHDRLVTLYRHAHLRTALVTVARCVYFFTFEILFNLRIVLYFHSQLVPIQSTCVLWLCACVASARHASLYEFAIRAVRKFWQRRIW